MHAPGHAAMGQPSLQLGAHVLPLVNTVPLYWLPHAPIPKIESRAHRVPAAWPKRLRPKGVRLRLAGGGLVALTPPAPGGKGNHGPRKSKEK